MYRAMRIVILVTGLLAALLLGVYAYGLGQPLEHTASVRATISAPPSVVWAAITDYPSMPSWWPDVKSISEETRDGVRITWNEDSHGNKIGFITKQETREKLLVREILSDGQPFGGTWTFELEAVENGSTLLTITEKGFITPPVFRAVASLRGLDATMKSYMAALQKHVTR
jgi:uncharacterized protein YndB with AHSA1/START domain